MAATPAASTALVPGGASSAIPGASAYASAEVMANNAYNAALAQLNQNRLNSLTSYGYTGTIDPTTGILSGVQVDPNAIHGQLQDLLHSQAIEDQGANFAAQDRGLMGGLAHQAGSELHFQHGSQDTALGTNLEQQLADFQAQQQSAAETRDNALWQAEQDAANTATSNQEQEAIDQLIQSLGNPSDVTTPKQVPSDTNGGGGGGKPSKGGGKAGKKVGSGTWTPANRAAKLRAQRRILKGRK